MFNFIFLFLVIYKKINHFRKKKIIKLSFFYVYKENQINETDSQEQNVTMFNKLMLKHLRKIQKNKFNSLIVFLLHQLNILRRTESETPMKNHLKSFLSKLCFNKLPFIAIENGQPVYASTLKHHGNKGIGSIKGSASNLYEEYSSYMSIMRETCVNERMSAQNSHNILNFYEERTFMMTDLLMNELQSLDLKKRTELADSYFIVENGIREHLYKNATTLAKTNPFLFQKEHCNLMTGR